MDFSVNIWTRAADGPKDTHRDDLSLDLQQASGFYGFDTI